MLSLARRVPLSVWRSRPPPESSTPVVIIFLDGHQLEIQNYAIIGQTLWVSPFVSAGLTEIVLLEYASHGLRL